MPAPVVAQYLRENRVVPEKNDLNSLLFLLTPGVESSKAGTLVSRAGRLQAPARRQCAARRRHAGIRRAAAGSAIAACGCATSAPRCTPSSATPTSARCRSAQFRAEHLPEIGHDAARGRARSWCATTSITCRSTRSKGAIATTLFVVYPPGIATIVPGERLGRARAADDRLSQDVRARRQLFPGFEAEIQGLYREVDAARRDPLPHLCRKGMTALPLAGNGARRV